MLPNKKSSILLVLKVLEEYTDEEHYLYCLLFALLLL